MVPTATVVSQDREARVDDALVEGEELWLTLPDVVAATGWALKPEGVCKDAICVPVPEARRQALIRGEAEHTRFSLTEFARLIDQPFAHDEETAVWYFGQPGWEWKSRLTSLVAPDFELPDLQGQTHTLSELRGNKVFLLFWATW